MKLSPFAAYYFALVMAGTAGYLVWRHAVHAPAHAGAQLDWSELDPLHEAPEDPEPNAPATEKAQIPNERVNRPLILGITARAADLPTIVANHGLGAGHAASIYWKTYGIYVELKLMHDRAAMRAAFQTGQIDMMWDTVDTWALDASRLAEKSIEARAIMLQAWSRGDDGLVATSAPAGIQDLVGKRVAIAELTSSHWFLLYLLAQSKLSAEQRHTIEQQLVPAKDAAAAASMLERGEVDAAITSEPHLASLGRAGKNVVATTTAAPHVIADVLVARQEVIAQAADVIEAIVAGWFDAVELMAQHPEETRALASQALGLDAGDLTAMLEGAKLASYADNAQFFGLTAEHPYFVTLFDTAQRVWRKKGVAKRAVSAADCYDTGFLARLASRYQVALRTRRR